MTVHFQTKQSQNYAMCDKLLDDKKIGMLDAVDSDRWDVAANTSHLPTTK
jgi:hypothetical protein